MKKESVKMSLEKSKNVLEEKRKIVKRTICIKKDQHVYNNCYELRSRAIKKIFIGQNNSEKTGIGVMSNNRPRTQLNGIYVKSLPEKIFRLFPDRLLCATVVIVVVPGAADMFWPLPLHSHQVVRRLRLRHLKWKKWYLIMQSNQTEK